MTKFEGMLGLCARAGKLVSGEKNVETTVKKGTAYLVLIDGAISDTGRKAVTDACAFKNVEYIDTQPGQLGLTIGRPGRMTAAITDQGFAQRLTQLARNSGGA